MNREDHGRAWGSPAAAMTDGGVDTLPRQPAPARAGAVADRPPRRAAAPALRAAPVADRAAAAGFELAAVPVGVLTGGGRLLRVNGALARLVGRNADALRGVELASLLCGPSAAEAHRALREVGAGRRQEARVETSLNGAGGEIDVAITARPAEAGAAEVVITVEDLTACREAQRRLRELETELGHVSRLALAGELSAALAHEINQPLAAIANYTQAALLRLQRDASAVPDILGHLRAADAEARRAGAIVRSLAAFVRKRECRPRRTSLGDLLRETEGLIQAASASSHTPVLIEIHDEGRPVCVDTVQVQQVILNLVKNAAEASGAEGTAPGPITVRASLPEDAPGEVELSVRDSGCGLPPDTGERVFSPFFTTKPHGMGLGLTICRSIIEAHGGRLWGENNPPPSAGATFRFRLPLSQGDQSYDG